MGKGNGFVQQALSLVTAAATLLPGMPAVAGAAEKEEALKCFNNTGGKLRLHLEEAPRDKVPSTVACVTEVYGLGSRDPEFLDFATEASRRGFPVDSAVPRYRNMQLSGSAGYSGSAVPGCTLRSAYDPAINRKLQELYDRCVLAHATAETTRAESGALAAQKKYECILNQDQVNALISQENKRINAGNTAKSLFTLITAGGSAAAFATKNDKLGWPLAAASLAGVLFFPQRQMIQTENYAACAIIKRNLAATNGL
jgi:hypothetical protein